MINQEGKKAFSGHHLTSKAHLNCKWGGSQQSPYRDENGWGGYTLSSTHFSQFSPPINLQVLGKQIASHLIFSY